jgi:hypothetical protein
MYHRLISNCAVVAILIVWVQNCGAAQDTLDVNDISIRWPVPKLKADVQQLIGADTVLDSGGTIWPKDAFETVLHAASEKTLRSDGRELVPISG